MELEAIGRVENPDDLDFTPLVIPIVGYSDDKKEVITKIRFVRVIPMGVSLDTFRATDADGNIGGTAALDYVDGCVHREDKHRWQELLHGTNVNVEQSTIIEVYKALGAFYADRPTKQRSGSRSGPKARPTSQAAAKSRTSTKKNSR